MVDEPKKIKKILKKREILQVAILTKDPLILEQKGQSSVELKRNSKGAVEFVVKVYNDSPEIAKVQACKTFDSLDKKYKYTG